MEESFDNLSGTEGVYYISEDEIPSKAPPQVVRN